MGPCARQRLAVFCCLVLKSLALSTCASVGVFQSPETLGKGRWEVSAELSAQAQAHLDSLALYPTFALSGRYGLGDSVDLGARIGPSGLEAQTKVMLTSRGGTVVSLAPSIGGAFSWPQGLFLSTAQATLPVLIGLPLNQQLQLVFAPRLHDSLFILSAGQSGATVNTLWVGGAIGVVMLSGRVKLIPDIGFLAPLATTTWRSDLPPGTAWTQGRWTFQGNLTFALGSSR